MKHEETLENITIKRIIERIFIIAIFKYSKKVYLNYHHGTRYIIIV